MGSASGPTPRQRRFSRMTGASTRPLRIAASGNRAFPRLPQLAPRRYHHVESPLDATQTRLCARTRHCGNQRQQGAKSSARPRFIRNPPRVRGLETVSSRCRIFRPEFLRALTGLPCLSIGEGDRHPAWEQVAIPYPRGRVTLLLDPPCRDARRPPVTGPTTPRLGAARCTQRLSASTRREPPETRRGQHDF